MGSSLGARQAEVKDNGEVKYAESCLRWCSVLQCLQYSCKRSIGSHNHGEGPYYGLLLVESAY